MQRRTFTSIAAAVVALGAIAQDPGATPSTPAAGNTLLWVLGALAVLQTIIIMSLAGILRSLGGMEQLARRGTGRALVAVPLLLAASAAQAQDYVAPAAGITEQASFWWLVALNLFLFLVIVLQLRWTHLLTTLVIGSQQAATAPRSVQKVAWWENLAAKLNRQVKIEEEKSIELDHDYDGIKELDNVLPPWWVWLFYGTIAWGVLYIVNVHVIKIWPGSTEEYRQEMAQAQVDIAAYQATQTNSVDENNVTATDDPTVIAEGRKIYEANCVACHGADASGSEFSVGPNLTDPYWLHGGGIKNVFKTIKYGVPEKGMIAWKAQLQPAEIRATACYILAQQGKGGATQKAPQGDLWKEEGATATADTVAAK
ncbi:MAG TPA: cbb3-type cytochrome c oxidase N-terminal domain-containing protein [Flavobacteriales bacterium]|nr:cbb3-type cytochrome c oxidase N-terminal domain-containing protein [Flavobacteriales bacterium]